MMAQIRALGHFLIHLDLWGRRALAKDLLTLVCFLTVLNLWNYLLASLRFNLFWILQPHLKILFFWRSSNYFCLFFCLVFLKGTCITWSTGQTVDYELTGRYDDGVFLDDFLCTLFLFLALNILEVRITEYFRDFLLEILDLCFEFFFFLDKLVTGFS